MITIITCFFLFVNNIILSFYEKNKYCYLLTLTLEKVANFGFPFEVNPRYL